jgi:hypothetical protein
MRPSSLEKLTESRARPRVQPFIDAAYEFVHAPVNNRCGQRADLREYQSQLRVIEQLLPQSKNYQQVSELARMHPIKMENWLNSNYKEFMRLYQQI